MNELTLETLNDAIRLLKEDPLLKRGIQQDWVCVIHPLIEQKLKEEFKLRQPEQPPFGAQPPVWLVYDQLRQYTGRKTYVIDAAPQDRVEYMSEETMRSKYNDWFLVMDRLRKHNKKLRATWHIVERPFPAPYILRKL
jgi:hypothetical protein